MKKRISRAGRYERPDYSALFSREQLAAVQNPERLRAKDRPTQRAIITDYEQQAQQGEHPPRR